VREAEQPRTAALSASALLGSQVMLGRIRLGVVRDTLLGADLGVVLGLVVETEVGRRCFLPWAGARFGVGTVAVAAPSLLFGEVELDYYLGSGIRFLDLIEGEVALDEPWGIVGDVLVRTDGSTSELVVVTPGGRSLTVAVGDVRVRWSAGATPELSTAASRRRRRRKNGHRDLAIVAGRLRGV
jgi:hypothetical protein